jgi:hypothetical protein
MDMAQFFSKVEATFLAKFQETASIGHPGDKGENREEILSDFLLQHLPKRYGVTKGQAVTRHGIMSHSADIIIYDSLNCPVLYQGRTAILPIEGVYGIIEVKSRLTKAELLDAMGKIEKFKQLAPRDLGIIQEREKFSLLRPSRPFGAVFAYGLADNSPKSITANYVEEHARIHDVDYFTNMVCVLGSGLLLHYNKIDLTIGERTPLIDTDEFVDLILLTQKRARTAEPSPEVMLEVAPSDLGDQSFGRFFVFLLIVLERMKLNVPDLGRYVDPNLPLQIRREV